MTALVTRNWGYRWHVETSEIFASIGMLSKEMGYEISTRQMQHGANKKETVKKIQAFFFSWCQWLAATSACGSSWTFLFTFFHILWRERSSKTSKVCIFRSLSPVMWGGIQMPAIFALRLIGPLAAWGLSTRGKKWQHTKDWCAQTWNRAVLFWDPSGVGLQCEHKKKFKTEPLETWSMTGILDHLKLEPFNKRRRDSKLTLLYKGLKDKTSIPTDGLIPWLCAAGIIHLWHCRSRLLILIFISVAPHPLPRTKRDWNALPESLTSSAAGA